MNSKRPGPIVAVVTTAALVLCGAVAASAGEPAPDTSAEDTTTTDPCRGELCDQQPVGIPVPPVEIEGTPLPLPTDGAAEGSTGGAGLSTTG